MKIRPITRIVKANALTNPDPAFVSMCGGPANQEPFRAVRSEDFNDSATMEADMKLKKKAASSIVAAIAQKGHGVMQFQFDKNVFKTADDVTAWMDEGGYSEYEIVERAKMFEVVDENGRFEVGSIERVDGPVEGVVAFVGKLTELQDEEEPAVDATVTKADELSPPPRKRSSVSTEEPVVVEEPAVEAPTVEAVAEEPAAAGEAVVEKADEVVAEGEAPAASEGMGHLLLGEELAKRVDAILANPVFADSAVKTRKSISSYVVSDIACAINSMRYLIADADYTGLSDEAVSLLKSATLTAIEALVAVAAQFSTEVSEMLASKSETVTKSADEPAPVEAPVAEPVVDEPVDTAEVTETVAEQVAKAVTAAMAPVNEALAAAQAEASEARKTADDARNELAARVEADASQHQSRKAADEIDPPAPAAVKTERCAASTSMLSAFGSRHAR